jgi:hypothetical protein
MTIQMQNALLKYIKDDLIKDESNYTFSIGQKIRIKSTLDINVGSIKHLLGKNGIIIKRRFKRGEDFYTVRFETGDVEEFEYSELDLRYRRKNYISI